MDPLAHLQRLRAAGIPCALATVTHTQGSIPRRVGAKMVITGQDTYDTIGGGKFEGLVIADARRAIASQSIVRKTYPLHEHSDQSFGAICGGEVTVFIEAFPLPARLFLVGGGHCAQAVAALAGTLGFAVTVFEDREAFRDGFEPPVRFVAGTLELPAKLGPTDAVAIMSRNPQIDTEALATAVGRADLAYVGMIGSRKKINAVFDELSSRGVSSATLARVNAPIGLPIGADTPAEIAVSVLAEILQARHDSRPQDDTIPGAPGR